MVDRPAALIASVSLLLAAPAAAGAQTADSLEGAWVLERVERRQGEVDTDPGPALLLFTESHLSVTMVVGDSLPSFSDPDSPAESEKAEAYDRLYTSAGPYRLDGDTLVVRPFVDKDPRTMDRWPEHTETLRVRVDGDRLQLYNRHATQTFRRVEGRLSDRSSVPGADGPAAGGGGRRQAATGPATVRIDGSGTLFPLSERVAEAFGRSRSGVRVAVNASGTAEALRELCRGEVAVVGTSRSVEDGTAEACAGREVDLARIPVARGGVAVVVHRANDWARCVTVEELRRIWRPGSGIDSWRDVRSSWPDREMRLFGPGPGTATHADFTRAVVGEAGGGRATYSASEDPNVTVAEVGDAPGGLGYVGLAYARRNRDRIRALAVDDGTGCVEPGDRAVRSGKYAPLSRTLYLYVREDALRRPGTVRSFVDFYLERGTSLVPEVGYVPLGSGRYDSLRASLDPRAGPGGSGEGTRFAAVAWEDVSFALRRPPGWALTDLSELTGGVLDGLVLMRDRRVAEERYDAGFSASTDDTLSLGSADNVLLTLADVPVDPSETGPAAFLREVVAGAAGQILPDGEVTGEVRRLEARGDSVAAMPFRGRDREGRRVRGWLAAVTVEGVLLQAQLFAGPEAPAAAVDSAVGVLGSLRPAGGG